MAGTFMTSNSLISNPVSSSCTDRPVSNERLGSPLSSSHTSSLLSSSHISSRRSDSRISLPHSKVSSTAVVVLRSSSPGFPLRVQRFKTAPGGTVNPVSNIKDNDDRVAIFVAILITTSASA
jgi:hypothetical protein